VASYLSIESLNWLEVGRLESPRRSPTPCSGLAQILADSSPVPQFPWMAAGRFNYPSRASLKTAGARQPLSIPALRRLRLNGATSRTEMNERLNLENADRAASVRFGSPEHHR